MNVDQETWYIK